MAFTAERIRKISRRAMPRLADGRPNPPIINTINILPPDSFQFFPTSSFTVHRGYRANHPSAQLS